MVNLRIITPTGTYLVQSVDYLEVRAPHSVLGILPGHAPLVSTLIIGPLKTKVGDNTNYYAAGEGYLKHYVELLLRDNPHFERDKYQLE